MKIAFLFVVVVVVGGAFFVLRDAGPQPSPAPQQPTVPSAVQPVPQETESIDDVVNEIIGEASDEAALVGGEDDTDLLGGDTAEINDLSQSYVEGDF